MKIKQCAAVVLSTILIADSFGRVPVMAQTEAVTAHTEDTKLSQTIIIKTADELAAFARSCTSEAFSQGVTVRLDADIYLKNAEFEPIPIFCGVFDGNGHTINGLTIQKKGSDLGLFRYVQEGAVIQKLNVSGRVIPEGSRKNIGGIAGVNRGTIRECTFKGVGRAMENLGGIAGLNEETGVIDHCMNKAELNGNRQVGGITGENLGTVRFSSNSVNINDVPDLVDDDEKLSDIISMDLSEDRDALRQGLQSEKVNDIGGIAGVSSGIIEECTNDGKIGYTSVGYNVGGIVGRSKGILLSNENMGHVSGRKDIGGIAGQLEPQLLAEYEKSTLDQVTDIMGDVLDTKGSIVKKVHNSTDNSVDRMDRMDEILKEIKNLTRDEKDYQREQRQNYEGEASWLIDEIDTLLNGIEPHVDDTNRKNAVKKTKQDVADIKSGVHNLASNSNVIAKKVIATDSNVRKQGIFELLGQMTALLGLSSELYDDTTMIAASSVSELGDAAGQVIDQMKELKDKSKDLFDLTRNYKNTVLDSIEKTDDDVTVQLDELYDELDRLTDDLKADKRSVREDTDRLDAQLEEIHAAWKDGQERIREDADRFFDDKDDRMFDDISDSIRGLEDGVVQDCTNQGLITADYQGGGIVGTIGTEFLSDPDFDIEKEGDRSLNWNYYTKAAIQTCSNRGDILVKNDYAGGIVGAAWQGMLRENQNYGDVETTDGNYAGGIAGSSQSYIYNSYSMNEVTGNNYAGGIVGHGSIVKDNCAMVNVISEEGENTGSIAGYLSDDGEAAGNLYVDDGLGAIDGATFQNQAAGIRYEELMQMERVPEEFRNLKVTFLVDDEPYQHLYCNYGDSIREKDIPKVPVKTGFYEMWEDVDLSDIRHNCKVHAIYKPWNNTIAASEDPKPELLATGEFMPGTSLIMTELTEEECRDADVRTNGKARWIKAFRYEIAEAVKEADTKADATPDPSSAAQPVGQVILHVKADKADEVILLTEEGSKKAETKKDGEYLVFEAPANGQVILIKRYSYGFIGGIVCAAAAVLAGLYWILRKK